MANLVDVLVGYISPAAAVKRKEYRDALNVMNSYEGASRRARESYSSTMGKDPSANALTFVSLHELRKHSRYLVRNTPMGQKAISAIQTGVIGNGIKPSCKDPILNKVFQDFALDVGTDYDRRMNLYGLQGLIMRTIAESGEVLIERIPLKRKDTKKGGIGLRLRVLEPDYLVDDTYSADPNIIQGVKFGADGQRSGYMLYEKHPGDNHVFTGQAVREEPEEDIIHAYRVDRSEQVRGVPWAAPIILKAQGYDKFEDAQLKRQQVAACFATYITSPHTKSVLPSDKMGSSDLHGATIQPGLMVQLRPGEQIEHSQPPGVDGYEAFAHITLHQIAAGFGISYTSLTGDFSKVNFSSSRMAHISEDKSFNSWRDHIIFSQVLERLGEWMLDAARVAGHRVSDDERVEWTAGVREMTNPKEEIEAANMLIESGLSDLPTQQRKFGRNPEDILEKVAASNAELDRLGITLSNDMRKFAPAGSQVVEAQQAQSKRVDRMAEREAVVNRILRELENE